MKPQNSEQMILSALNPILNKARFLFVMTHKHDSHGYIFLVQNNVWFAFKSFGLKEARNVRCKIGIQICIVELATSFLKSTFCRERIYHWHLKMRRFFYKNCLDSLTWSASCIYLASFAIGEAASPNPIPLTIPKPANSKIGKVFILSIFLYTLLILDWSRQRKRYWFLWCSTI